MQVLSTWLSPFCPGPVLNPTWLAESSDLLINHCPSPFLGLDLTSPIPHTESNRWPNLQQPSHSLKLSPAAPESRDAHSWTGLFKDGFWSRPPAKLCLHGCGNLDSGPFLEGDSSFFTPSHFTQFAPFPYQDFLGNSRARPTLLIAINISMIFTYRYGGRVSNVRQWSLGGS